MVYSLTWLPGVLEDAGLKVAEDPGWQSRGRGEMARVRGVICHHTVGPATGNMPSLGILRSGRSNLAGPLAQLGLGRDGTYYVIAAGRANHAGEGSWKDLKDNGNYYMIGIEAENMGTPADKWPPVQMDAYKRGVAAILRHAGCKAEACIGHKEWAPGRKPDPLFDMNGFRSDVAAIMAGTVPVPPRIPAREPSANATQGRNTLRRGAMGPLVKQIQTRLQISPVDGVFGPYTEAAVREFQRAHGLVPDGIVGPKSWAAIDAV